MGNSANWGVRLAGYTKRRTRRIGKAFKSAGRTIAPYKAAAMPYVSAVAVGVGAGVATYYGGAAAGALVTAGGTAAAYQGGNYWGATAARADGASGREARDEGRSVGRRAAGGAAIGGSVATLGVYGYQGYNTGVWGVWGSQAAAADAAAYPVVTAGSLTGEAGATGGAVAGASNTGAAAASTGVSTKDVMAGLGQVTKAGWDYYQNSQTPPPGAGVDAGFGGFGAGAGAGGGGGDVPGGGENPLDGLLGALGMGPKGASGPGGIPPILLLAGAGLALYYLTK